MPPKRAAGDKAWIQGLLAKHEGPLTRYVSRLLGDVERAREVVQESFLRLLEAKRSDIDGHVTEWLFTVCRNRAIDLKRRDRRQLPLAEGVEIPAEESESPSAFLESAQKQRSLLHALTKLPANQREVIRLKFQEELSYREISRIMGLSESNVGYLIHTAIKTMREETKKEEIESGQRSKQPMAPQGGER